MLELGSHRTERQLEMNRGMAVCDVHVAAAMHRSVQRTAQYSGAAGLGMGGRECGDWELTTLTPPASHLRIKHPSLSRSSSWRKDPEFSLHHTSNGFDGTVPTRVHSPPCAGSSKEIDRLPVTVPVALSRSSRRCTCPLFSLHIHSRRWLWRY